MSLVFFFIFLCKLSFFRVLFPQQRRRQRRGVQRDDARSVGDRGTGRPPVAQTLADRAYRAGVRPDAAAAAGQRHVERDVRDRG